MEVNTMPKYTVNGSVWVSCDFEADSEEEAREMYQESANDLDQLSSDMHTVFYRDISSVEEEQEVNMTFTEITLYIIMLSTASALLVAIALAE